MVRTWVSTALWTVSATVAGCLQSRGGTGPGASPEPAAPTPEEELGVALAELGDQAAALASGPVEYVYSWVQESAVRPDEDPQVMEFACRCVTDGAKYRHEERMRPVSPGGPEREEVRSYDGKEYRGHLPDRQQGSRSSRAPRPMHLLHLAYHVGEGDVGGLLAQHAPGIEVSRRDRDGGSPVLVAAFDVGAEHYEVHLDPDAGYQPRTVVVGGPAVERVRELRGVAGCEARVEVLEFKPLGAVFLPARAELVYRETTETGQTRVVLRRTLRLESARRGVPVEESTFRLDFPEGTRVRLADSEAAYTAGADDPD
jgi:hypothetical protein